MLKGNENAIWAAWTFVQRERLISLAVPQLSRWPNSWISFQVKPKQKALGCIVARRRCHFKKSDRKCDQRTRPASATFAEAKRRGLQILPERGFIQAHGSAALRLDVGNKNELESIVAFRELAKVRFGRNDLALVFNLELVGFANEI